MRDARLSRLLDGTYLRGGTVRDFLRFLVLAGLGLRWWERLGLFVLVVSLSVVFWAGVASGGGACEAAR